MVESKVVFVAGVLLVPTRGAREGSTGRGGIIFIVVVVVVVVVAAVAVVAVVRAGVVVVVFVVGGNHILIGFARQNPCLRFEVGRRLVSE